MGDLTTTELSRLLGLSKRQVQRLIDAGRMGGYRVPGTGPARERRVPVAHALAWARTHGLPAADRLAELAARRGLRVPMTFPLLWASPDRRTLVLPGWAVTPASDWCLVWLELLQRRYRACVLDAALGSSEVRSAVDTIMGRCPETALAVLTPEDQEEWLVPGVLCWRRGDVDGRTMARLLWQAAFGPCRQVARKAG